jgi:hypothetical protein
VLFVFPNYYETKLVALFYHNHDAPFAFFCLSKRLWCVWELFTLFAFMGKAQAEKRVEFVPLVRAHEELEDVLRGLQTFSLPNSHCFDPNEEARLRDIIHARGGGMFEGRIRDLAASLTRRSDSKSRATSQASDRSGFSPSTTSIFRSPFHQKTPHPSVEGGGSLTILNEDTIAV